MKNKFLVGVYVPLIEKEFDIYIPVVKKVGTIKNLIISAISELTEGAFIDDGCKRLYYKDTGEEVDVNEFVKFSKIKNGTKLILY